MDDIVKVHIMAIGKLKCTPPYKESVINLTKLLGHADWWITSGPGNYKHTVIGTNIKDGESYKEVTWFTVVESFSNVIKQLGPINPQKVEA